MRQRHFAETNSKPCKVLENAHAAKLQSHKSGRVHIIPVLAA